MDAVTRMKLYRAHVDSRHFEFEGYGLTERDAVTACMQAWSAHCCQITLHGGTIDRSYIKRDDISAYEIQVGKGYRDRETIEAPKGYTMDEWIASGGTTE